MDVHAYALSPSIRPCVLTILNLLISIAAYGYPADSTSLHDYTSTPYSRSQLIWQPGVNEGPSINLVCPASSVTINAQEHIIYGSFSYINGITKGTWGWPNGKNVAARAILQAPQFIQDCETLQTDLNWQAR